ncbi:MAG TPA: IucA/IucC family C-terminal-domain containing protein [Bacillales bacterium]|nr:IucA/IucC family C-terminal-domain containing protein [Bacillales bacterium]
MLATKHRCFLEHEEKEKLICDFRFAPEHAKTMFAGSDLLSTAKLEKVLTEIGHLLHSPSMLVTASQFSKRYSFAAAAPVLYAMTIFDQGLDVRADNCRLASSVNTEKWLPRLQLDEETSLPLAGQERSLWRKRVLQGVFKENLTKVNAVLAELTAIPEAILWENTAVYVFWLYEQRMKQADTPQRAEIKADFRYLVQEDDGEAFGLSANPLKGLYDRETVDGLRVRQTCCLYYQLPGAGFCSTCRKCWRTEP